MAEDESDKPASAAALGWDGFAADPRVAENAGYRASDADRHHTFELLAEAYSDGRLNHEEYEERLDVALQARTLGEFPPLVNDLLVPRRRFLPAAMQTGSAAERRERARGTMRSGWMGWIMLAVLFNVIWLATVIGTGSFIYWWPFWPMLGTAIPTIIATQAARRHAERPQPQPLYPPGQVPPELVPPPVSEQLQRPPMMLGGPGGLAGPRMMPPPGLTAEQRMRWLRQRKIEQERRRGHGGTPPRG